MSQYSIQDLEISRAFQTLESIESTTSTLEKQSYLQRERDNTALRELLKAAYDPNRVYYIKQIPEGIDPLVNYRSRPENFELFTRLLSRLETRQVTGHEAIDEVIYFIRGCSPQEVKWYSRVIKKDLNIGIQVKTINAAIPGLIEKFGVQLAQEFAGRIPSRMILQPKLDGYRALGCTTTGLLYSRNGKIISGYDSISEELLKLPKGYYVDGEIMSSDFKGTQTQAFRKSSDKQGILNAFDLIPESGVCEEAQITRATKLADVLAYHNVKNISLVPFKFISTHGREKEEILRVMDDYYRKVLDQGYEGIMIKDADAPYEKKRTYAWQKLKPVKTIDLRVIGIEEGEPDTKYVGCVGRLVCNFEGNEVRVGSGLTDEQRILWWHNPTAIVGKIIEIKFQEISTNANGTRSLRFPRFVKIRPDKE